MRATGSHPGTSNGPGFGGRSNAQDAKRDTETVRTKDTVRWMGQRSKVATSWTPGHHVIPVKPRRGQSDGTTEKNGDRVKAMKLGRFHHTGPRALA